MGKEILDGTLEGHVLVAIGLSLVGLWWIVNIHCRYYTALANERPFKSSLMFYFDFLPRVCNEWPFEALVIISINAIGLALEFVQDADSYGSWLHLTMYLFYGSFGLIELLTHFRVSLPPGIVYVSFAQASIMQSLIFSSHVIGQSPLNAVVHNFLLYAAILCALFTIIEISVSNSYTLSLARAYLVFLQGTWFFQAAFVLFTRFGDGWDRNSHESVMFAAVYFAWHVLLDLVFVVIIGMIIKRKICGTPRNVDKNASLNSD